jgi:hypothetical protein
MRSVAADAGDVANETPSVAANARPDISLVEKCLPISFSL